MQLHFNSDFLKDKEELREFIYHFDSLGTPFGDGERNQIKLFEFKGGLVNVKRFKNPNLINSVVYKFFRPSKAERSYKYGLKLLELGIGTPAPMAYALGGTAIQFKASYYMSQHLDCDLTYRELVHDPDYPKHEEILRAFTQFTYKLHQAGVLFKDHSPGNTLIKITDTGYAFYLVDLNRMKFKELSKEERIANFARLTPKKDMVAVMSDEYAKLTGFDPNWVNQTMWNLVSRFQEKYHKKRRLKQKYLFWRKPS